MQGHQYLKTWLKSCFPGHHHMAVSRRPQFLTVLASPWDCSLNNSPQSKWTEIATKAQARVSFVTKSQKWHTITSTIHWSSHIDQSWYNWRGEIHNDVNTRRPASLGTIPGAIYTIGVHFQGESVEETEKGMFPMCHSVGGTWVWWICCWWQ